MACQFSDSTLHFLKERRKEKMVTHISVVIHVLKLGVRVPMLQLKNLKILMVHPHMNWKVGVNSMIVPQAQQII